MINLSDAHAEIVRGVLETLLADETNSMGFIDTTSGGACSADEVGEIRSQWREVYDVLRAPNFLAEGLAVELVSDEGHVFVRAVTVGATAADGNPLVRFVRADGTSSSSAVGWPAKYMRPVK